MTIDLHGIFRCVAPWSSHKHQKYLVHSLVPIINVSIMDRVALRFGKLFLSGFPKDLFRDFNRVFTADPHDSDS